MYLTVGVCMCTSTYKSYTTSQRKQIIMKTYQNYVDILGGKVKRSNDPNLTILLPKTCRFCRFFEVLRLQRHLDGGKAQREGCCIWALGHKRGMEKKESDILWWSTKRRAKTTLSVKGSTFISPYWKLVSTWLDRDGTFVVRMMWFCGFLVQSVSLSSCP